MEFDNIWVKALQMMCWVILISLYKAFQIIKGINHISMLENLITRWIMTEPTSHYWSTLPCLCVCATYFSHVPLFATLCTTASKDPSSMGFSRQEYGSGLLLPPPGDLPNLAMEPTSPVVPAVQADLYHWATGGVPTLSYLVVTHVFVLSLSLLMQIYTIMIFINWLFSLVSHFFEIKPLFYAIFLFTEYQYP